MNAIVLIQSYDRYGGHSSISTIGTLLEQATDEVDCGVATFEATACFRTERPPKRTLEELQARFHADLAALPRFRWEPGKRRLAVRYESRLGLAEEVLEFGPPSRALLLSALNELVSILEGHRKQLSRKPELPAEQFLGVVHSLHGLVPSTDAEVAALQRAHSERRRAESSARPWWEQLEIDWAQYHPSARTLLNDPFFWREANDFSPHGNDTGADLLADFRKWRRRHRHSPPLEFLEALLRGWGFSMDWRMQPLDQWNSDAELAMHTHDEAAVALAFALIKLEGSCDSNVCSLAMEALMRQRDERIAAHFGWNPSPERVEALEMLRAALDAQAAPSAGRR